MMKKIVLLTLILFVASCSFKATKKEPEQMVQKKSIAAEKKEKQNSALKKVGDEARPIIDNILQSIKDINYETYIKDFDSTMKSAYHDKEQFRRINKGRKEKYGEPGARPLVTIKKNLQFYILTYLVKFSKVEKPIPVIMTLKREGGKLRVSFLQFKFSILKK